MIFLYLLAQSLDFIIGALTLLMFARSILSLFMFDIEENRIMNFIYAVTDAICAPVRFVCDRMGWFQDTPIDVPHLITFILLVFIRFLIPEVYI